MMNYLFWFFSQLVGRKDSRSQGFEDSRVVESDKPTAAFHGKNYFQYNVNIIIVSL